MKDHEKASIINKIRDTAIKYRDSQQLREQIRRIVLPILEEDTGVKCELCGGECSHEGLTGRQSDGCDVDIDIFTCKSCKYSWSE